MNNSLHKPLGLLLTFLILTPLLWGGNTFGERLLLNWKKLADQQIETILASPSSLWLTSVDIAAGNCALTNPYPGFPIDFLNNNTGWLDYDLSSDLELIDNGDGTKTIFGSIENGTPIDFGSGINGSSCGSADGWAVELTIFDKMNWATFQASGGSANVHGNCSSDIADLDYWNVVGTLTGIGCNAGRAITITGPKAPYRLQIGYGANNGDSGCAFGLSTWFDAVEGAQSINADIYAFLEESCYNSTSGDCTTVDISSLDGSTDAIADFNNANVHIGEAVITIAPTTFFGTATLDEYGINDDHETGSYGLQLGVNSDGPSSYLESVYNLSKPVEFYNGRILDIDFSDAVKIYGRRNGVNVPFTISNLGSCVNYDGANTFNSTCFSNGSPSNSTLHAFDISFNEIIDQIIFQSYDPGPGDGGSFTFIISPDPSCSVGKEICGNGIDDDGDGLIDCADPDCGPIISAGIVSGDEVFCSAYYAEQIIEHEAAQSSSAQIYQWEQSTDLISWSIISGVTSATYDPGMINSTVYFRRGVGSSSCAYFAYSNIIRKVVDPTMPICLDNPDWESGCDTAYTVFSSGDGIKGLSSPGVRVLNPTFYEYYIAKAVFSGGANAPNSVIFTNEDGVQQTANKIYFEGESGINGNRYFQAILPATDSVFISYNGDAATGEALVVLGVQQNTHRISFGDFIHRSIAPGQTFTFDYLLPAQLNQRDVYVNIPFSGLVNDGTELIVRIEANGIIDSDTITTYDDGNSLNISYLNIEGVSQNETTITVTISSPAVNGKTALISGAVAGLARCDHELVILVDSDANCPTVGDTIHYTYTLYNFADYFVAYLNNNSTSSLTGPIDFGVDTIFGNSQIIIYETYVVTPADLPGPLINDVRAMGHNFAENGVKPIWDAVLDSIELNCAEICDNGIDDDGDGLVDCLDPDCQSVASISNVSVSDCIDLPYADVATVDVTVNWNNILPNDTLQVSIAGATSFVPLYQQGSGSRTVQFIVPADGTSGNSVLLTSFFGQVCDEEIFNSPTSCSSNGLTCKTLYICGDFKYGDDDAWDHGFFNYLNAINGITELDAALAKKSGPDLGLYDVSAPNTLLNVTLADYDLVILSPSLYDDMNPALIDSIRETISNVLVFNNYQLINLGMTSSKGIDWNKDVHDGSEAFEIYNYPILNPTNAPINGMGDYYPAADVYLWRNENAFNNNNDGVMFHYEASDVLIDPTDNQAFAHGTRTFFGMYVDGVYTNAENGGALPVPDSLLFDPTRHLTIQGKYYLDLAVSLAANTCGDNPEICGNGLDDDGDGDTDCNDGNCGPPIIDEVAKANPLNCPVLNDGQITISAAGTNLEYSINNGLDYQNSNVFNNLTDGDYIIRVRNNATGCFVNYANNPVTITDPVCVEICYDLIDNDGDDLVDCLDPDCLPLVLVGANLSACVGVGTTISATGSGGSGGYTYTWDNGLGEGESHGVKPGLGETEYIVIMEDGNGCVATDTVSVTVTNCPEICNDGIDNDGDDLVDCDDPDCLAYGQPQLEDDYFSTCPGVKLIDQVTFNDGNLQNPLFSIHYYPSKGMVSINQQGVFTYTPFNLECGNDQFIYEVCNQITGCCNTATVNLMIGDNDPPILINVPEDITLGCSENIPEPAPVYGQDLCPGIFVSFDEESTQVGQGNCNDFVHIRVWEAADLCGNIARDTQFIYVVDDVAPEIFRKYTLSNGRSMIGGVAVNTSHQWKYVEFPTVFPEKPIVLVQRVSNEDGNAAAPRIRNVTVQGFELMLQEEEIADRIHGKEEVAWVAVEPGSINDASNLQVKSLNAVTNNHSLLNYNNAFTEIPVTIAAMQTSNDLEPATIRFDNHSLSSIEIWTEEEKSLDVEVVHGAEEVGCLAMLSGKIANKKGEDFGEAGVVMINHNWQIVQLTKEYTKPVVVFGGASNEEGDAMTILVKNVTTNSFEVRVEEWDYLSGQHADEAAGYFVMEGSVPAESKFYCGENERELVLGEHLFAKDNCDNQVTFEYIETDTVGSFGLKLFRSWSAIDDCGNKNETNRVDTCSIIAFRLRASLFGAFYNSDDPKLMRDELREQDLIPLTEPYSEMSSYEHYGEGGEESISQEMLDKTGEEAIVDWVVIEVRNSDHPDTIYQSKSALIQRDGRIVGINGDTVFYFPQLLEGDYHLSLKHRNHLGIMTGTFHDLNTNDFPLIDFSSVNTLVNGNEQAAMVKGLDKRHMWLGDVNGDNRIIYQGPNNDIFVLFSHVLSRSENSDLLANYISNGYWTEDVNLDCRAIYQGPNNDRSLILYHSILTHPSNGTGLANFIVLESLP